MSRQGLRGLKRPSNEQFADLLGADALPEALRWPMMSGIKRVSQRLWIVVAGFLVIPCAGTTSASVPVTCCWWSEPRNGCWKTMESTEMDDADASADTWFVYIMRCADNSLYTGITKDVDRRLKQHNAGTASRYTRGRLPVSLEYQEEQPSQSVALKRELAIKALSRKAKELLV